MSYRATPLPWCNFSPAELFRGRRIRTTVPQTDRQLAPQWTYMGEFRRLDKLHKGRQKQDYDRQHRAKELPEIPEDVGVWITSEDEPVRGRVLTNAGTPRSYVVQTPTGEVRRNRSQLRIVPETPQAMPETTPCSPGNATTVATSPPDSPRVIMTRTRTGTEIKPPERFA